MATIESTLLKSILAHVDEQAIIELASDLIRIPSFKPNETAVATFLADFFRQREYQVDLQQVEPGRFQTIATLTGTGGGKSLMLNGHTDIKCIGFDSVIDGTYRNLYEGTENYRRDGEKYTPEKAALWKEHHSLIKKHYENVEIEYLP